MLKNQKFGVEIEFTGITRRKAAGIVAKVLGCTVGSSEGAPYFTRTMIDSEGRGWKVMRDSSIVPMRSTAKRRTNTPAWGPAGRFPTVMY